MRLEPGTALALALAMLGSAPAAGMAPNDDAAVERRMSDAAVESLLEFADRFDQAQLQKNGAALELMVDDDLVFITAAGTREGKRQFISGWTSPGDSYDPVKLSDRVVVRLGDDAGQVSAEAVLSGTSDGKPFSSRFRFTDTFRLIDGKWRAVHIQVTRVSP